MFCPGCGKEVANGSAFCSSCGTKIGVTPSVAPVQSEIQQQVVEQMPVQQQSVVQQPVQQPTYIQSSIPPIQATSAKKGMASWQKGVIIGLLSLVVVLMLILLFTTGNGGPTSIFTGKGKYNSRTIMVYMVGSNLESGYKSATGDMREVDPSTIDLSNTNILLYTGGTTKWHNQIRNDENAIYKLTENGFEKIESYPKVNMSDGKELTKFLQYGYDNYKADQFNLIVYDHGGAYQGAVVDDFNKNDIIELAEFDSALAASPFNGKTAKLNSVSFRACLMGSLEVAKTFSKYANYLVAAEEEIYLGRDIGVFGYSFNNLKASENEIEFGKRFIEAYDKKVSNPIYGVNYPITYSIIDLNEVDNLLKETTKFLSGLDVENDYREILKARTSVYQFPTDPDAHNAYESVDLKNFINQIAQNTNKSADSFNKAFEKAVVYNHASVSGADGLTVYFPYNNKNLYAYYKKYNYLGDDYNNFIEKVYNQRTQTHTGTYTAGANSIEVNNEAKEITYELPEGLKDNYYAANYFLFRRNNEHPNYYQIVVNSTDVDLDGNKVKFKLDDKMLYAIDNETGKGMYFTRITRKTSSGVENYTYGTGFTKEQLDENNKYGMQVLRINFSNDTERPKIRNIQIDSRNESLSVGLYDINDFSSIELMKTERMILDKNGKLMDSEDWEGIPVMEGLSFDPNDFNMTYKGMDDGEWCAIFFVYDIDGNTYQSELIKVGN